MRIRQLKIENFRGIKSLDWIVSGTTICLIGANDSTKSTILHAIQMALSDRWNITFTDTDFYNCDTSQTIEISVIVSDLPENLISIDKYGEYLMGWDSTGLIEEPKEGCETVIAIKLTVNQTLEPAWNVYCGRGEKRISSNDRQMLGLAYVGAYVDRDFSWGKGTPLSRVTDNISKLDLPEINRQARNAIENIEMEYLDEASRNVENISKPYGIKPKYEFTPAFDPDSISINTGALALHDGKIPIRQYGLGSKRLISLAMQKSITRHGAIVLIDEIEHGLEPFRIRQLIRLLRPPVTAQSADNKINHPSQVIMTSHATTTLVELQANELHIVKSHEGITSIKQVGEDLQFLARANPEALLSHRVIVCEGKTEVGILRAMDRFWASISDGINLAFHGVSIVDGGGNTDAPKKSIALKTLGYDVILFVDSDQPCNPTIQDVEQNGIKVVVWGGETNTEERMFLDLPIKTVLKVVNAALSILDEQSILSNLGSKLNQSGMNREKLEVLLNDSTQEQNTRIAIGEVASSKKNSWFKRTDLAEAIGDIIAEALEEIQTTDFALKIKQIKDWVYGLNE